MSGDLRFMNVLQNSGSSQRTKYMPQEDEANLISEEDGKKLVERTESLKKNIMEQFKLTGWDDANNPFRHNLYRLDQIKTCVDASSNQKCYTGTKSEIEDVLNFDVKKLKTLASYNEFVGKMNGIYIVQVPKVEAAKQSPQEFVAEIEKSCQKAAAGLTRTEPEMKAAFDNIRGQEPEVLKRSKGELEQLKKNCDDMGKIRTYYAWGAKGWKDGESCSLSLRTHSTTGYYSQSFQFQMAQLLNITNLTGIVIFSGITHNPPCQT
jgi:hypothetical protein